MALFAAKFNCNEPEIIPLFYLVYPSRESDLTSFEIMFFKKHGVNETMKIVTFSNSVTFGGTSQ